VKKKKWRAEDRKKRREGTGAARVKEVPRVREGPKKKREGEAQSAVMSEMEGKTQRFWEVNERTIQDAGKMGVSPMNPERAGNKNSEAIGMGEREKEEQTNKSTKNKAPY